MPYHVIVQCFAREIQTAENVQFHLTWNSIPVEVRNTNAIDAFIKNCLTWMKDL